VTKGLNPDAPMKDSGVEWLGEVPEHWGIQRVKHLCASVEQGWSPQ
jgi:type I restriction enzyme S subunit